MASAFLTFIHFNFSQYVTGAFQAATLMVELRFWGLQKFLPPTQSVLVFAARSCGDLFSWHWNISLGWEPGVGLLAPKIPLPNFYLPCMDVGPAHSVSPPLQPVWTGGVSLIL